MKKIFLSLVCAVMAAPGFAQLSMGAEGLYLSTGTSFIADSMIIITSVPRTYANNVIQRTSVTLNALSGTGNSLARVYNIANPFLFSGIIGFKYATSELAGNPENQLQIALRDTNYVWTTATTSSVDQINNILTLSVPTARIITRMSGTRAGVALPLAVTSFDATLKAGFVNLSWKVSDNNAYTGFDVQSSSDGSQWRTINHVTTTDEKSEAGYAANDYNMDFNVRYYRLALIGNSATTCYTSTVSIRKDGSNTIAMTVQQWGNQVQLNFSGTLPEELSVYDMNGHTLTQSKISSATYDLPAIVPGIYIARYLTNGVAATQRFTVQ